MEWIIEIFSDPWNLVSGLLSALITVFLISAQDARKVRRRLEAAEYELERYRAWGKTLGFKDGSRKEGERPKMPWESPGDADIKADVATVMKDAETAVATYFQREASRIRAREQA